MNRTSFATVVVVLIVLVVGGNNAAPIDTTSDKDLEKLIHDFLDKLYDRFYREDGSDIYEQMQGDQPSDDNNNNVNMAKFLSVNFSTDHNMSQYLRTSRDRYRENDLEDRAKDNWIQVLKENILRQIGRSNMTVIKPNDNSMTPFNVSIIPTLLNSTIFEDDHITEKIRSYYPSCDVPSNMDQDMWKDDNLMNLYFNTFDHVSDEKGLNIATATLRLYRIPSENSTKTAGKPDDCSDSSTSSEEERLLRVSIYWYTRSVRKKKVKRRLSDSKVIQENAHWVELSVKPATKAWSRGKNLGLAVLVEDQEGNVLKADKLFKGALCTPPRNPFPLSSPTTLVNQTNLTNEFIAYLDEIVEIQHRPYLVTYQCYQP